jgi:hypothetical protein
MARQQQVVVKAYHLVLYDCHSFLQVENVEDLVRAVCQGSPVLPVDRVKIGCFGSGQAAGDEVEAVGLEDVMQRCKIYVIERVLFSQGILGSAPESSKKVMNSEFMYFVA